MNANNKEYTIRPLTPEEREFAADPKNHNCLFFYMRQKRLDPEKWYDILIEPYLNAVKKYHEYESARQYAFATVCKNMLWTAVTRQLKMEKAKKRIPEDRLYSLDFTSQGDNPFAEYSSKAIEEILIDKTMQVEKQVIFKELFHEFYKKCVSYEDEEDYGKDAVNEYLKYELDLLLEGYTLKQVNRKTEKVFPYGYKVEDVEYDLRRFRRIFAEVFGI